MREDLPDRMLSPDDRTGWYAFPPDGYRPDVDDDTFEGPPEGSLIRFMSEISVDVPLWGPDGLIFNEGEQLVSEWGVSRELADEVVRWGRASSGGLQSPDLDAEAARLIRALAEQTNHSFRIVYHP